MIYLDNAATGGFKPRAVTDAVDTVTKFLCANPGRSGHRLAISGAKILVDCRNVVGQLFDSPVDNVIFTKNCTEALNVAIFGTLKVGGHVITTIFEHNSVLRPLYHLAKQELITLEVVSPTPDMPLEQVIENAILPNTYLVVCTSVSNVTGEVLDLDKIGEVCKRYNILFLVDGAQGAGHIPISLKKQNISMLAVAGHKGLYAPMGTGCLLFSENTHVSPLLFGGTGIETFSTSQPQTYPEKLEAGTLNLPGIAGLLEGATYVKNNLNYIGKQLLSITKDIIDELNDVKKVKCYSKPNPAGIVAFEFSNLTSSEATDLFNAEHDIALRGGFHCAPLMHKYLNTDSNGLVRASFAVQNSSRELSSFIRAVQILAKK